MPFDPEKLRGLSLSQRSIVITRLANVLLAAAGVSTQERADDEQ
jgi:hypothetical protein